MNLEQHARLREQVESFKLEVMNSIDNGRASFSEEIQHWREGLLSHLHTKFQRLEEMLSGPYNRELIWDWVPDDRQFDDIAEFLRERRVRLRDDPRLEMSGTEYFEKFAKGGLGILKVLEAAGFFTPPATRFFLPFCKQLVSGEKALLRLEEAVPVRVPAEQIDLAFSRAQDRVATDYRLQKYCPLGIPVQRCEKEFYINVVNSLAGLPYRIVQPLSDLEQRDAALIRRALHDAEETLNVAPDMGRAIEALEHFGIEDICTSPYLQLMVKYQKRIMELETAILESPI